MRRREGGRERKREGGREGGRKGEREREGDRDWVEQLVYMMTICRVRVCPCCNSTLICTGRVQQITPPCSFIFVMLTASKKIATLKFLLHVDGQPTMQQLKLTTT